MHPFPEDHLSLSDVAKHWSREHLGPPPPAELLDRLIASFWLAELSTGFVGDGNSSGDRRSTLLRIVSGDSNHPGLYFIRAGEKIEPEITEWNSGAASYRTLNRMSLSATGNKAVHP